MRRDTAGSPSNTCDLDLVDVVLDAGHHGQVPVDHGVEDRVQHGLGAVREEFRILLQPVPYDGEVRRLGVPDRDDEVLAEEHVQLAELDLLEFVHVPGRAEHHEQGVAVAFEFRPLVCGDRVLDGERVQIELAARARSAPSLGPVEPDPRETVALFVQALVRVGQRLR